MISSDLLMISIDLIKHKFSPNLCFEAFWPSAASGGHHSSNLKKDAVQTVEAVTPNKIIFAVMNVIYHIFVNWS